MYVGCHVLYFFSVQVMCFLQTMRRNLGIYLAWLKIKALSCMWHFSDRSIRKFHKIPG